MNPQDLALYQKYVKPQLGEGNTLGALELGGTLLGGLGAQAINGLGQLQGQDTNIQPPQIGKAGIEAVKSIAPAYYDIKNGPVGRAAGWLSDKYHEGVQQDADLAGKYLGPSAAGVVGALGETAPMAISGPGGEAASAEKAIAPAAVRALEHTAAPRDAIYNSTMGTLEREGEAARRDAEVEPRSLSAVPAPDSHLAGIIPDDATVFTAKHPETGEVQGFAATVPRNGGHQMLDIHVNPVYRRQGIGRDLYNAAVADAHSKGLPVFSDTQVSPEQMANVMHSGHSVEMNPSAVEGVDTEGDPVLKSGNGQPVYTIHPPTSADDATPDEMPHGSWVQNQGGEAGLPLGYQAPQELEDFVRSNAPPHRIDPNGPATWEELQARGHEPVLPVNPQSADNSIYSDTPTNIAFRAWHDKLHLDLNAGFDHDGELKVAQEHLRQAQAAGLSDEAQRALWADTWETFKHHEDTGNFPSDPRAFVAQQMQKQFPGDGSMLNVGLNQGTEGQPGFRTMDPMEAQNAIESTGARVTKSSALTPEQHGVSEPTLVASTDRPLDEPEMQSVLAHTKQSAIPQRTNAGATSMHVAPGHEQVAKEQGWDTFNPEYFRDHDGATAPAADSNGTLPSEPPPGGMAEGGEVGTALGGLGELPPEAHALVGHIATHGSAIYDPHSGEVMPIHEHTEYEPTHVQKLSNSPTAKQLHDHIMASREIMDGLHRIFAGSHNGEHFMGIARLSNPQHAPGRSFAEGGPVLSTLADIVAKYAPDMKPIGNTLYRGTEAGTPGAALRKSSDGEMGPGIYYTQHKWLAGSYGGGPKANVKNGTRVVHEADVGPLAPEHVAYAWQPAAEAGTGAPTYITSSTGDLLHTYDPLGNRLEAVQSRQAIPGVMQQNGVKVVVGHDAGIAGNQVSVIDPSILKLKPVE